MLIQRRSQKYITMPIGRGPMLYHIVIIFILSKFLNSMNLFKFGALKLK